MQASVLISFPSQCTPTIPPVAPNRQEASRDEPSYFRRRSGHNLRAQVVLRSSTPDGNYCNITYTVHTLIAAFSVRSAENASSQRKPTEPPSPLHATSRHADTGTALVARRFRWWWVHSARAVRASSRSNNPIWTPARTWDKRVRPIPSSASTRPCVAPRWRVEGHQKPGTLRPWFP